MPSENSIVFSGIVPHPPIMVPEVGRDSVTSVRESVAAMAEFTKRLIDSGAETLVLISPHARLNPYAFVAYQANPLQGDFAQFRAPMTQVQASPDEGLIQAIVAVAAAEAYDVLPLKEELDHGTLVPLYFMQHNGWEGRVVALGYSFLSDEDHLLFGSCISRAATSLGRAVAFVASGDLSHRLIPSAPAGYNPRAYIFDDEIVKALRANRPERIVHVDQDLRRLAGECGYRSILIALGATQELPPACEVLSYEAPFGVGYLVAQLTSQSESGKKGGESAYGEAKRSSQFQVDLPTLARRAVEHYVMTGEKWEPSTLEREQLATTASCFVSIKNSKGELRGCMGTIEPMKAMLADEIVTNAINAATRDPRFPPVAAFELADLHYSVDVLSGAESVSLDQLNPAEYGVIVEDEEGSHRGLLLPDIEGIDTVTKQVEIAARKAGIAPGTPVRLSRFRVKRFRELVREDSPSELP